MLCYIVGNGLTRNKFDINNIRQNGLGSYKAGPIFACNAAYRDFTPDYLFALDTKIIQEISQSSFPKDRFIVPPIDEQYEPAEYNPNRPRNNAAMVAMKEAIRMGYTHLICIGLDFVIEDKELNIANIYDGTNAYGLETRAAYFDTISRFRFMDWFSKKNPHIKFDFVFPKSYNFREFRNKDNVDILITEKQKINA